MKLLIRTVLSLALIVWLGAEIFFPIVAAITFDTLRPDTHTAGMIVGHLLRILHGMGFSCGMIAVLALALGATRGIFHPRAALLPMSLLAVMIVLDPLFAAWHPSGDGAGPHRRRRGHRWSGRSQFQPHRFRETAPTQRQR